MPAGAGLVLRLHLEAPVNWKNSGFVGVALLTVLSLAGCGGSTKPPSVSVNASATALDGSNAVTLTATVTNDKTTSGVAQGVTWSLVGSGTLSNTTTSAATYTAPAPASAPVTVTITATSIANTAKSSSITLTIHAALAVTTTNSQLAGIVGTAYSVQLSTSDGIPPYNWSLASGSSLPSCLTMTTAGVISGALTPACVGSYSITFNVSDSGSPNAMSASETLTLVILQTPTLTFAAIPTHTYGDAPFTVSATSASIGAVTYSVTSGPATISGNMVTITGAGTVVLGASQAANGNFTAATASTSFTVNPETPVLNFAAIPTPTYGDAPFSVSATSASSGAVTYSVTSGPATIAGSTVTLTGAGTVVLKASQAAVGNYAAATATTSFSANPGTAALTFAAIPTHTYGDAPFTVSATSASSGAVTYSVTSGPATISGNTVTITGIGTVVLGASQVATTNYNATTATISFTVNPEVPTLTFAAIAARTFGDAPFTVSATSASSGAVTYSVTSGQATISGNMVTITGAGTVVLGASQAADGNYAAATASTSFTVNPEVPSLVFAAIGTQIFGEPPFTVSATSASSGTVTYSVTSGPATISGNTVTLTGAGTVVLGASQAAAGNYAAATATISFTVNPETLTLTFAAIPAHNYGDAPFTVSASSLSTGVVTYSVVSGPATISGSTVTITGVGTVQLQANQAATANYAASTATTSFTVNPGTPTLTFAAIPAHTYGDAPFTVSASSASNGAVTYSVNSGPATISGSTVTITGAGTVVLGASQVATANYNAATASISFAVNPEVPTLTFAAIPAHTFGDAPFTVSATSASSGAVTYSVTSGPATIAGNTVSLTGAGTVVLKAMQAASGNYAATTATTSIVVNPETPTLVFAAIPTHTYGDAPFTVSATSASSGAVTYSVTSGPATIAGNTVTITGVGTVVLGASQAASGNYGTATASTSFAVNPETPNLVFAAIPTHTFGDAPFTVNATSASSGAVTYSVTSGPATIAGNTVTLTGAGIVVLGASQAASGNYGTATASTSFTVNPETPTLVFAAIPTHTFGDAPFTVSATSVSSGAVTYSVTSGPATISGNTVTLTGPGTVVLGASQAASGNYASSTASISFSVNPAVSITTGTTLPPGVVGGAYSLQLSATGGSGGYNWSVTSGYSLPGWMSLSVSGGNTYLMGTPLAAASAVTFNLTVTDSTSHSANATFSVTVTNQLTITTTSLPVAYTGSPFPATSITAAGGTGTGYSFTWAAAGGSSIPPGLSLATSGAITGSPSAIGAYSVAITVKDSSNATAQRTLSVTIYAPLSLPAPNPASLPSTGTVGASYNGAITATGGSGSYSWTLTGLQLTMTSSSNGATLTIGGIPNAATTVTLNVKVTDTATNANVSQSYNIVVTNPAPLTLPVPNPVTLGSATSGQSYSGTIVASGGVGPNYTWTVNGLGFSQPGLYITLGDGLSATTNDNNVLTITGTPTSPTSQGNPISFTVAITDSASPANSTGPLTYTIVVNSAGSPVSGQIMPANICGNPTLPIFNVSINTSPIQTVQTDSNGNYSFAVVPNGTYTITPSISAAGLSSLFYPATQANIQVNNNVSGVNFSVSLGYTVSGNVSYSGSQSGRVYLELNNNNCGGNRQGTSIASSTISTNNGAFSIRGVSPGNYTLNAWLDPASLNFGTQNAVDPVATVSNLSISNASLTNKAVPLVDPGAVTLSTAPTVQSVNPIGLNSTTTGRAVMISYRPITNGNNDELATSYTVEWSVNSDCSSPAGTKIFPASGDSSNVFLLNTANVTGMTAGNTYYFCVRGNAGASSSGWTLPVGPVIITAPSSGFTVSGSVTIPSSVTPSGPLYVGLYDQNSNAVYGTVIASPSNSAPNTYSIKVPAGSNYFLFTILDQNNDGLIDVVVTNLGDKPMTRTTTA